MSDEKSDIAIDPAGVTAIRAVFDPYAAPAPTLTMNGLLGEITVNVIAPGHNPTTLPAPIFITINNNRIASTDMIFLTTRHDWIGFKEAPVFPTVVRISNGQATFAVLSTSPLPFFGYQNVFLGFQVVKTA